MSSKSKKKQEVIERQPRKTSRSAKKQKCEVSAQLQREKCVRKSEWGQNVMSNVINIGKQYE